ncbi:hypothetical protein J8273_3542 [Carpediemonas membranifera]|uniref:Uncharacterized protein n=1 Tax=Carpediemonas membranifera TaxID=201153 RepID=A0A8J6ASK2_9EUKA|nr:hypothetical protein J8273_3542 [Carpediemonas membranifera]|eukprot:KAG9393406.1 hypothetical protein J8273_3542 [Carpediemonas membranifera]
MFDTTKHTALTRARMPRALEVYSHEFDGHLAHIARTPKGMWGWGYSELGQLGFQSSGFVDPTRLTFPACPKVAELEASLPAWEKHGMVTDVSMDGWQTFILTPVGIVAGADSTWYVGPVERENSHLFHPVSVPTGFVPDHIMHAWNTVILSMGDRQVISGVNWYGQLGLGHENDMSGFVDLPFRVDRIMSNDYFNVFLSDRQLLFAGEVPRPIAQSGLLSGYSEGDKCLTATPLRFRERVKGFFCGYELIWVTEGRTHMYSRDKQYSVPFEATAFDSRQVRIRGRYTLSFRNSTGQWFYAKTVSDGVAELVECEAPRWSAEIIPVDLDPWAEL